MKNRKIFLEQNFFKVWAQCIAAVLSGLPPPRRQNIATLMLTYCTTTTHTLNRAVGTWGYRGVFGTGVQGSPSSLPYNTYLSQSFRFQDLPTDLFFKIHFNRHNVKSYHFKIIAQTLISVDFRFEHFPMIDLYYVLTLLLVNHKGIFPISVTKNIQS